MENEKLFANRQEFRDWLSNNHDTDNGFWIVFGKRDSVMTYSPTQSIGVSISLAKSFTVYTESDVHLIINPSSVSPVSGKGVRDRLFTKGRITTGMYNDI